MSFAITATVLGGGVVGGAIADYFGKQKQAQNIQDASGTQSNYAQYGIDAQNDALAQIQKYLSPYMQSGSNALNSQNDLMGLNGDQAQQQAISGIQSGAQFQSLNKAGQDAILSNAAATGGLRGGNVQGALASNSQNVLNNLIQQRFSNLGSLSSLGQNSAMGMGQFQQNGANQISNLLQQKGAAIAGGQMGQFNPAAAVSGSLADIVGGGSSIWQMYNGGKK